MQWLEVRNVSRSTCLGGRIGVADRWWARLRGLIGRGSLPEGGGLLITPCQAVHTLGLRTRLDVLFVDSSGTVVATYEGLGPASRTKWHRTARSALEVPDGTICRSGTMAGDRLAWQPVTPAPAQQDLRRSP